MNIFSAAKVFESLSVAHFTQQMITLYNDLLFVMSKNKKNLRVNKKTFDGPKFFEVDIAVSKMIKQRINDQTLQEDDQCDFE